MTVTARLERNVVAISAATLLLALGESLWKRFVPKYLEALGAPLTPLASSARVRTSSTACINTPAA